MMKMLLPEEGGSFSVYIRVYMGIYKGYGKPIFDFEFGIYSSPPVCGRDLSCEKVLKNFFVLKPLYKSLIYKL